eukprot:jgi/Picsp_1/1624/NSC_05102-R1_alpha- -mannosyltransferase subunit
MQACRTWMSSSIGVKKFQNRAVSQKRFIPFILFALASLILLKYGKIDNEIFVTLGHDISYETQGRFGTGDLWETKVVYDSTNSHANSKLWQTFRWKKLTKDAENARLSWLDLNPSLSFEVWMDERVDKFVRQFFGKDLYLLYQSFPLGVMKADLWRYAILFAEGGIYADVDTICQKEIDKWFPPREVEQAGESLSCKYHPGGSNMTLSGKKYSQLQWKDCQIVIAPENDQHFCQWTIASVAGHPILSNVLRLIFQRARQGISKSEHFVHYHTGPAVWTDAIVDFFSQELGHKKPVGGTALDMIQLVWEVPEYNAVADKFGICMMASSFFGASSEPENVRNLFGSIIWETASWTKEREKYLKDRSE